MTDRIIAVLIGMVIGAAGTTMIVRSTAKPCPDCVCPPSVEVKIGEFSPDKIKFKKGDFHYENHNEIRGTIVVADSSMLKLMQSNRTKYLQTDSVK